MSTTLLDLHPDVFHAIAGNLSIEDYYSLSLVNRHLRALLTDDHCVRHCIKHNLSSSIEGRAVTRHGQGYWQSISRIHQQREALKYADPYSVSQIADVESFLYADGALVYLTPGQSTVRILDLCKRGQEEKVLSRAFIISKLSREASTDASYIDWDLQLRAYKDDIVCVSATRGRRLRGFLLAFDVSEGDQQERCLLCAPLPEYGVRKLQVVSNKQYLYYCWPNRPRYWDPRDGRAHWSAHGFHLRNAASRDTNSLNTATCYASGDTLGKQEAHSSDFFSSKWIQREPFQLCGLSGLDVGTTIAFTIFDDHFIAVSNAKPVDCRGSEHLSPYNCYYHYVMFPLDDRHPSIRTKFITRRNNDEGVIHDSWTRMSFGVDEVTGKLLLTEARREWKTNTEDKMEAG
ncbi:uncharacterized protein AB675_7041 [Cyphellophora attinorum]|uniref:F-box domain-containing protein n=1 Tax=Cyphellophora attinorum TaxID=1664694 RepID=A0A0N1HV41_9EURO|nr:uncharacterized protein AB675_7041 [Phialophora attinorum]KPI43485.1 hypothetical protein AB675_7041 [Phialophora attinorum]